MTDENTTEVLLCARCEQEIPAARLEALPGTIVCLECSEAIDGDFELEVRMGSTGKVGSLKLTGQTLEVRRVKKQFR
ncbi:MAG: TraR/DksA C4-type zinc finger protein [Deltaproteobacteria bacterium]